MSFTEQPCTRKRCRKSRASLTIGGKAMEFDLLLKGGHVIDPANGVDGKADVGIKGAKIARVAPDILVSAAGEVVDVSGYYVTPGIVDIHTHVYTFSPAADSYIEGVSADAHLFASGVTTAVDAGTAGWKNFPDFKAKCIDRSKMRILAFINIASDGMVNRASEQNPRELGPKTAAAVAEQYPDVIVGIKAAHYWTSQPWDADHPPWASVERAVEAGESCGRPVMVDFWPRPPERSYLDLLLEKLRPGDIHTHVYARQFPIIGENGRVCDYLYQARDRGVKFDLGHGAASFWFRNAIPALRDGFPPDSISTDLHMDNINGPVVSMLHTMSKYLSMGMSLREVIKRSTAAPARAIGHSELGTLSIGSEADVAVFRHLSGTFGFADCGRAKLIGKEKLECVMTLRAGNIVYDPTGLSMPEWENAPGPYWEVPKLQA
jgi:dihydroorotase